ncbi:ponticulin-like protein H [Dysidea avara]|uniref:ponticulin-like protein H n=1 Tax=Dysidea avara TaxID=196820 RepID=UPI0033218F0F
MRFEFIIDASAIPTYCELTRNGSTFVRRVDPHRYYRLQHIYFVISTSASNTCPTTVSPSTSVNVVPTTTTVAVTSISISTCTAVPKSTAKATPRVTPTTMPFPGNGSGNNHLTAVAIARIIVGVTILLLII